MRLLALARLSATLALFTVIASCATPQYQTNIRLIPPADAQGRACIQDCETKKHACQANCQTRYQACVKDIEPRVNERYSDMLKQYERDLNLYAAALRNYEIQLRFEWLNSHPFSAPYWRDPWPWPYSPFSYPEPVVPTRESARAQLVKSSCLEDCGCFPAYDACFVGCGGQRISETVCIRSCPATK